MKMNNIDLHNHHHVLPVSSQQNICRLKFKVLAGERARLELFIYISPGTRGTVYRPKCDSVNPALSIFHVFVFSRIMPAIYCYSSISIEKEYKNRIPPYSAANLDTVREAIFCFVA